MAESMRFATDHHHATGLRLDQSVTQQFGQIVLSKVINLKGQFDVVLCEVLGKTENAGVQYENVKWQIQTEKLFGELAYASQLTEIALQCAQFSVWSLFADLVDRLIGRFHVSTRHHHMTAVQSQRTSGLVTDAAVRARNDCDLIVQVLAVQHLQGSC